MNRKLAGILSMAMCFSLIFSGCKSDGGGSKDESQTGATSITLFNIKSEIGDQLQTLAAAYEKETGVHVEIMGTPAGVDAQATLKAYYLSDQMPDIIACEAAGFSNWEGLLADMSEEEWASKTESAFIDGTYGTIGFPYTTEAIGLAYNKDVLDKCGIDPASITGPDSMRAAFETINAQKDALGLTAVVGYLAEPRNAGWSAGNHLFGVYIDSGLEREDTTYIDQITTTQTVDSNRFTNFANMMGLFRQYGDPALLTTGTYDDQVNNFAAGRYAFVTQGSWIGATLSSSDAYAAAGSFEVGMIPYAFEDGMDTILTSAPSWWAVPKEGNTEAAKAFLQWCSEDAGQKILVEDAGCVSPFSDCSYVANDPFAKVLSEYISSGKTSNWHWMDLPQGLGNSEGGLCDCFYRYASGGEDAAGFLNDVNTTIKTWYEKL